MPMANPRRALPARRQSSRSNAAAPNQKENHGAEDDDDLPDRGVKGVEEPRMMRADPEEREDADEVEQLHRGRAEDETDRARAQRGGEGDDRGEEDQHRLDAVAAALDRLDWRLAVKA